MKNRPLLTGIALLSGAGLLMAEAQTNELGPLPLTPARTVIVKPAVPVPPDHVGKAARLLQDYLRKASGATSGFDIISETNATEEAGRVILALGLTKWAEPAAVKTLWQDGFVIRRKGSVISICGGKERGTFHGAVEFLNRFAGVRFYMPGDLWTSLPTNRALSVPDPVDIRSEPFVKLTSLSGTAGDWADRNALNTRNGLAGTHQHNMYNVFPPALYTNQFPEVYPVVKGQRVIPKNSRDQGWNPCFTSPQTLEAAEKSAVAYFAANPTHLWFCLGLQDSHAACECENCQTALAAYTKVFNERMKAGNPGGITSTYTATPENDTNNPAALEKWARMYALSQLQWKLVNELAARLETKAPGKLVEALAYGVTSFAPDFPLHSNAMMFTQIHVSDNIRGLMDPRPDGRLPLDRFVDASAAYGNHDWYHGVGHLEPRIYSDYWTQFLRHLKKKNKSLVAMHTESYPNWGMDGLKYWVLGRTWWAPDSDPTALWRQCCADLFGPAAEPMVRYFQTLERWYIDLSVIKGPKWKLYNYSAIFSRKPEDLVLMKECRARLNEAAALVQTDEEKKRLELLSKSFRLTEYLFEAGAEGASPERVEEIRQYFKTVIQPDPMTLYDKTRTDDKLMDAILPSLLQAVKARQAAASAPKK